MKYWTDGKHANHGFALYASPKYIDYLTVFSRETKALKNRPALFVVYVPGG